MYRDKSNTLPLGYNYKQGFKYRIKTIPYTLWTESHLSPRYAIEYSFRPTGRFRLFKRRQWNLLIRPDFINRTVSGGLEQGTILPVRTKYYWNRDEAEMAVESHPDFRQYCIDLEERITLTLMYGTRRLLTESALLKWRKGGTIDRFNLNID